MLKPLHRFVRELRFQEKLAQQVQPHPDEFLQAAKRAADMPSLASGICVTVLGCQNLVTARGDDARPYVSYQFPGYEGKVVDSPFGEGPSPKFDDSHVFEFGDAVQTSQPFLKALRKATLHVVRRHGAASGAHACVSVTRVSRE